MSLYNMLFDIDASAPALLAHLGITADDVPRFRDCFIEDDKICLYTRMGGGNRGHWDYSDEEEGPECSCPGCRARHFLPTLPGYLYNEDDDFDCTYASYYYALPAQGIAAGAGETAQPVRPEGQKPDPKDAPQPFVQPPATNTQEGEE